MLVAVAPIAILAVVAAAVLVFMLMGAAQAKEPSGSSQTPPSNDVSFRVIEKLQALASEDGTWPMVIYFHTRGSSPEGGINYQVGAPSRLELPEGPIKIGTGHGWYAEKGATADQETLLAQMRWTAERLGPFLHNLAQSKPTRGKPILIGMSQGGGIASMLAAMFPDWWGGVVVEAAWLPKAAWTADIPPTVMLHGTEDTTIPYGRTKEWADWLQTHGAPVTFYTYEGMGHGPNQEARAQMHASLLEMVVTQGEIS